MLKSMFSNHLKFVNLDKSSSDSAFFYYKKQTKGKISIANYHEEKWIELRMGLHVQNILSGIQPNEGAWTMQEELLSKMLGSALRIMHSLIIAESNAFNS